MPNAVQLGKVTLNLRAGDFDRLRELYPTLPPSVVVRQLVSNHIDKIEAAALSGLDDAPVEV